MSQAQTFKGVTTCSPWKEMLLAWWPLIVGLLVLYVPTFFGLATGIWSTEGYAHGPIILSLSLWMIVRNWPAMLKASKGKSGAVAGWPISILGLLLYCVGRSQGILMFEIASFIVLLVGIVLIIWGASAIKVQWFPFFFMLFMIPLFGGIVATLTLPMKIAVSYVTENILFYAGYPIGRSGVILQIGQYQLMVADACAGLQTLLSLEALGLFYLNITRHTSVFRNVTLGLLIIPISFTANVVRVMTLTLITYHFGDAIGQGFLHGFAGILLFLSALALIVGVDTLLQFMVKVHTSKHVALERLQS
ncbi:exosortase B [Glaciimonas immobilis]|uniref:Exosortase B n=1 Tax=Glaciimonas immobilis TaxID=728004 RepID=A0A840RQ79_9BURK|nr:exosortase B [Glaciimonas immobilis]KAF3998154.1 exosortase B [Glaciimonas immobilis]MBB5199138.1 exosortase B [Glaciimonas immobilis]